ncbi:MAG: hypothetical protein COW42_14175, partial [Deltaproteobacteria bacterium CG17_big_fil_post_rev_8_21_14_2_50_63_7]
AKTFGEELGETVEGELCVELVASHGVLACEESRGPNGVFGGGLAVLSATRLQRFPDFFKK